MTIGLALMAAAAATANPAPGAIPGIWSIGATRNCASGPAWVFMADGYYVETRLPDGALSATGTWREDGDKLYYTHSHTPFADMLTRNEPRAFTVVVRTADRLDLKTYRGDVRVFHRCPAGSLKAPVGTAAH